MPTIFLATFCLMPDGEPGGEALDDAFRGLGVDARWVVWDDPAIDWSEADLVVVRSTWDYHRRLPAFRDWLHRVDAVTRVVNDVATLEWNIHKGYLVGLAERVPVVPTLLVEDDALVDGLTAAVERWGQVVIKPRVGASGIGVVVVASIEDPHLQGLTAGPWLAQPVVESIRTDGETSVYVFGGRAVTQVDKRPGAGELRVHEEYGGTSVAVPLDPARAAIAEAAVAAVPTGLPPYARVDLMRWEGAWVVSELELVEPGLYLDVEPATALPFAETVVALLG